MDTNNWYHRVADLADDKGISFGEAERILVAEFRKQYDHQRYLKRKAKRGFTPSRPRTLRQPSEPCYRYSKVVSMARAAGRDYVADCGDDYIEDAAYDIADSLLYDRMLLVSAQRNYIRLHGDRPSRQLLKEILADHIYDGMCSARKRKAA